MTIEELKDSGAIYFEKITEGMQQYDNQIVRMNEYQAVDKFTELWEACGCKNVYVDFYYFTLPQEAREQIDSVLAYQEREYVHQMEHKEGQVLFQANEVLFSHLLQTECSRDVILYHLCDRRISQHLVG